MFKTSLKRSWQIKVLPHLRFLHHDGDAHEIVIGNGEVYHRLSLRHHAVEMVTCYCENIRDASFSYFFAAAKVMHFITKRTLGCRALCQLSCWQAQPPSHPTHQPGHQIELKGHLTNRNRIWIQTVTKVVSYHHPFPTKVRDYSSRMKNHQYYAPHSCCQTFYQELRKVRSRNPSKPLGKWSLTAVEF